MVPATVSVGIAARTQVTGTLGGLLGQDVALEGLGAS